MNMVYHEYYKIHTISWILGCWQWSEEISTENREHPDSVQEKTSTKNREYWGSDSVQKDYPPKPWLLGCWQCSGKISTKNFEHRGYDNVQEKTSSVVM